MTDAANMYLHVDWTAFHCANCEWCPPPSVSNEEAAALVREHLIEHGNVVALPAGPAAPQTPLERRAHEWLRDHAGQEAATVPELQADVLIRDLLAELSRASAPSPSAALRVAVWKLPRYKVESFASVPLKGGLECGIKEVATPTGGYVRWEDVIALLGSTESP